MWFIPITNHANDHYSLSFVHSECFTNHSNRIHTLTPIMRIVATEIQTVHAQKIGFLKEKEKDRPNRQGRAFKILPCLAFSMAI